MLVILLFLLVFLWLYGACSTLFGGVGLVILIGMLEGEIEQRFSKTNKSSVLGMLVYAGLFLCYNPDKIKDWSYKRARRLVMQAIKGIYDNGDYRLEKKVPIKKGKIIVVFPEDESDKDSMSDDEAMRLFNKFTGSIKRDIDIDKERDEYFNEKYGPFN